MSNKTSKYFFLIWSQHVLFKRFNTAGFSAATSSFPAVLEICAPMLLVQQRNPTDEMNEQRPQASFQNSRQTPNPPPDIEGREITGRPNFEHETHNFLSDATICNGSSANSFDFFSRARFVSGEIAPAANEMRSTTPKSQMQTPMSSLEAEQSPPQTTPRIKQNTHLCPNRTSKTAKYPRAH